VGLALSAPEDFEEITESIVYEVHGWPEAVAGRAKASEVEPYLWFSVSFSTQRLVADLTVRPFLDR
jgi:hypothetical protein